MIDAHDTRQRGTAYGTSAHQHHRAWLEHDGVRVGYATCALSTSPDRHCPDEPDPMERLIAKHARSLIARAEAEPKPKGRRCGHRPERVRRYGRNTCCLDCQADRDQRRRIRDRLAREAAA